jgi:hypothetical protein
MTIQVIVTTKVDSALLRINQAADLEVMEARTSCIPTVGLAAEQRMRRAQAVTRADLPGTK